MDMKLIDTTQLWEMTKPLDELKNRLNALPQEIRIVKHSGINLPASLVSELDKMINELSLKNKTIDTELQKRRKITDSYGNIATKRRMEIDSALSMLQCKITVGHRQVEERRRKLEQLNVSEEELKQIAPDFDAAGLKREMRRLEAEKTSWNDFYLYGDPERLSDDARASAERIYFYFGVSGIPPELAGLGHLNDQ